MPTIEQVEPSAPIRPNADAASIRVLQLEDVPGDAEWVLQELRKLGISCTALRAATFEDFERELEGFAPDIVLLDYKPPEFDGARALEFVRKRHPEIPVVMLAESVGANAATALLKAGAADCVLKNDLARLAAVVRRALFAEQGIRARKAKEKSIEKSEQRYRRLFETAQDGILILDGRTGAIVDANPFLTDRIGYDRDELLGKMLWEIGAFVDVEASKRAFVELESKGYARYDDLELQRKDGSRLEVEFISNAYDVGGERVYQCNIRDIGDRRRAERALSESELRYRSLFENVSDEISVIDLDGTIRHVSDSIREASGFEPLDVIGRNFFDTVDPRDRDAARSAMAALVAHPNELLRFELRRLRKDGSAFAVESVARNLLETQGIGGIVLSTRDVTERKRAERELSQNAAVLSAILQQSPDGILLVDERGKVVTCNRRFVDIWDVPDGWLAEKSDTELLRLVASRVVDAADFTTRVAALYADRDATSNEEIVLKDGRILDRRTAPVALADGTYVGRVWFFRDITESRKAQQALAAAHERLQSAAEGADAGVWEVDLRTQKMLWDSRLRQQFALGADEPVPDLPAWLERMHADDRPAMGEKVRKALRGELERIDADYRVRLNDGSEHWFRSFGRFSFDADGHPQRGAGINLDITETKRIEVARERAEATVLASAHRFRAMIEEAVDIIAVIDRRGVVTYVSPSMQIYGGYAPEETLGRSVLDFIDPASVDDFKAKFARLLQQPGAVDRSERRYLRKDGTLRLYESVATNLLDDPAVAGVVVNLRDITERAAVQAARERLAAMVEGSNDAIMGTTLDGTLTDWNGAAEQMYGYSREEAIGMPVTALVAPEQQADMADRNRRLGAGEPVRNEEGISVRKDGSRFDFSLSLAHIRDGQGVPIGIAATVRDITASKQAEQSLRLFRMLIERSNDAIEVLDPDTLRFLDVNERACIDLGYSREELLSMSAYDIDPGLAHFEKGGSDQQIAETGSLLLEREHRRKDGSTFPVEVSLSHIQLDRTYELVVVRSISERKTHERALRRVNRALRTLSAGNSAVVHATSEQQLLQAMCDAVVKVGGYRAAWVGLVETDGDQVVRPTAWTGLDEAFVRGMRIVSSGTERGQGPTGRCIRSGKPEVSRDIADDPTMGPWRDELVALGCKSSLSIPLLDSDGTFGVAVIYAGEIDAFDAGELALLLEMAGDLAYGIAALRTADLHAQGLLRLERSMEGTVHVLAGTVEARDPYTAGHQRRVAAIATAIARELGMAEYAIHGLALAAAIHDIGKINIPAELLSKPTKLTALEFELIKTHAESGYQILKDVEFPWPVAEMVRQHHERLDGSGYPRGLTAEQILPESKILAVADVVEAMSSHRPYRPSKGVNAALEEIARMRGITFDADAVDACLRLFREKGFQIPD